MLTCTGIRKAHSKEQATPTPPLTLVKLGGE